MSELHGLIMNVRVPSDIQYDLFESKILAYKHGHKDARHAAAELSLDASRLIEDLKAELAGLRTGFDAQNEVIAGLKAEVERFSGHMEFWKQNCMRAEKDAETAEKENEELRKDAERYRWIKKESNLSDYEDCYSLPTVHAWDYKPGAQLNEQFESLDEAIDAAMGKGVNPKSQQSPTIK
ncbi:hypothetical protein [Pseudomonas protegens]|uniref:hypothetical protein n=1 Tax=Pseudomonas protegens TaxID=380021 RepID=UPI001B309DD7|nr:hypothetical protein [Pseudomonas protegens]MBP5100245.1 hypothetical protein [Pseudomonas protegens]MBP5100892.1 hypothetical protein [Pseudomonas protegens]QTU06103.1 hypothetical protein HUT25_10210 [Pseudomonas protegens]QTU12413.1 hypothetical protein HUT23_10900 [Pseudomonas protegens]QTU40209.1 hypothetical protein HUT24_21400 [Pseudomonas protegens]